MKLKLGFIALTSLVCLHAQTWANDREMIIFDHIRWVASLSSEPNVNPTTPRRLLNSQNLKMQESMSDKITLEKKELEGVQQSAVSIKDNDKTYFCFLENNSKNSNSSYVAYFHNNENVRTFFLSNESSHIISPCIDVSNSNLLSTQATTQVNNPPTKTLISTYPICNSRSQTNCVVYFKDL